ncbi:MAG: hypothetical protein ABSG72_19350 [Candidatus Sulfotelmatobacter sp.]|jgi:hypothetical protein
MKEIRLPAWREAIVNFMTMLSANLIYEALHKLRELGQGVSGMVFDSVAIAGLFALGMYAFKRGKETESSPNATPSSACRLPHSS